MGIILLLLSITLLSVSISDTDDQTLYGFPSQNLPFCSPYSLQSYTSKRDSQVNTANFLALMISAAAIMPKSSVIWAVLNVLWLTKPVTAFCQCNNAEGVAFCSSPTFMSNGLKTCQHVTFSIPLSCHTIRRVCQSHNQLHSIADVASTCPVLMCAKSNELEQIGSCCNYRNATTLAPTTPKFRPPKVLTVPTTTVTFAPNVTENTTIHMDDPTFNTLLIAGTSTGISVVGLLLLITGICCCCRKKNVPASVNDIRLKRFATATTSKMRQTRQTQKAKTSDTENTATSSSGSEESVFNKSADVAAYSRFTNERAK